MGATQPESVHLQNLNKGNGEKEQDFDDILELVGSTGRYQRIFLYAILVPLSSFEAIFGVNLWFLMDEPPHWCHVPGREASGMDLYSWRNLTIPKDSSGHFSKCDMFSGTNNNSVTSACTSGWEYDTSNVADYQSIVSEYDWVCDKGVYATRVFTATLVGRALGSLVLGWAADKIGRKPVFIITIVLFSFGRGLALFFPDRIWVFAGLCFFVGGAAPMFAISSTTIGLELSGKDYRAWILSLTWMTVNIGVVAVPTIALLVPNWVYLGWITILIGSISYLFIPWIPESPRWLLSRGRVDEVVKIILEIARWNGTSGKVNEEELKVRLGEMVTRRKEEQEATVTQLFSKRNLAKYTLLITLVWIVNGLVYHGLNLNSLNFHGHRYLNYALVILVEIPACYLGGVLSNKFGRRWAQVFFLMFTGIACAVATVFSGDESPSSVVKLLCAANIAKFTITMSFLVIYVQANELFPTPLRTTGSGFASTASSVTVIVIPYIIYAGKSSTTLPWILSASFAFVGMVTAAFIPETRNQKLPETINEADNFGKGKKFWSFRLPK